MGRIIKGATEKQEKESIEERRQFAFLAASRWPISWLGAAERHKRAADFIYEIAHDGNERSLERAIKQFREDIKKEKKKNESRLLEGEELNDHLDSQLFSDYLLLAGYALECVLKGLLLARNPDLVQDDKKLDDSITNHDLSMLCDSCNLAISEKEQQVVDVMTWQIQWGKYPAPKKLRDMPSPVEPNRKRLDVQGSVFHERQVQVVVDKLYHRACKLLEQYG